MRSRSTRGASTFRFTANGVADAGAAANPSARGKPSRRWQIRTTALAVDGVSEKLGSAAAARSTKNLPASEWMTAATSPVASGRVSGDKVEDLFACYPQGLAAGGQDMQLRYEGQ